MRLMKIHSLSVCCLRQVWSLYLVNWNVVSLTSVSPTFIVHLVLLLLYSVSYKIYCPT